MSAPDKQNPDHDPHAAGIYRAIALRFHARYMNMRRQAEFRGEDLGEGHAPLCDDLEASQKYQRTVDEWILESPTTADAILALVEFAGVIAADKLVGEVLREGGPVSDETDAFHQAMALTTAAGWLNERSSKEWLGRRIAAYGPGGMPCVRRQGRRCSMTNVVQLFPSPSAPHRTREEMKAAHREYCAQVLRNWLNDDVRPCPSTLRYMLEGAGLTKPIASAKRRARSRAEGGAA